MAVTAKVVSFSMTTGAGPQNVAHGMAAAPKVILFFANGQASAVDAVTQAHGQRIMGWAANTTGGGGIKNACCVGRDGHNQAAAAIEADARSHSDGCLVSLVIGSAGIDGEAHVSAIDGTNFTLAIDNAFPSAMRVHALCITGTELSNIEMGSFLSEGSGTVPFTIDYTTPGFDVTDGNGVVLVMHTRVSADNGSGPDSEVGYGFAVSAAQQANVLVVGDDAPAATSMLRSRGMTGQLLSSTSAALAGPVRRAQFSSWITGGFQLTWNEVNAVQVRCYWLCIKGGKWAVAENVVSTTAATTVPITGLGFTPVGGAVLSHGSAEATADNLISGGGFSAGVFSSPTERGAVGVTAADAAATSAVGVAIEHDELYAHVTNAGAIDGLMDCQSLDSDGVTFVMDDGDSGASWFTALLVGNPPAGGTTYAKSGTDAAVVSDDGQSAIAGATSPASVFRRRHSFGL